MPVEEVYPADHIRACAERSLANLGLERIDLLQLHVWSDEWTDQGDWREAVDELRSSGKIALLRRSRSTTTSPPTPCG